MLLLTSMRSRQFAKVRLATLIENFDLGEPSPENRKQNGCLSRSSPLFAANQRLGLPNNHRMGDVDV